MSQSEGQKGLKTITRAVAQIKRGGRLARNPATVPLAAETPLLRIHTKKHGTWQWELCIRNSCEFTHDTCISITYAIAIMCTTGSEHETLSGLR